MDARTDEIIYFFISHVHIKKYHKLDIRRSSQGNSKIYQGQTPFKEYKERMSTTASTGHNKVEEP